MENIELYEKNTQLLFAKSLVELGIFFSNNNHSKNKNKKEIDLHEEEMTKILNHFFSCILKLEKTVSDEHCQYLNQLIDSLVNNHYRIGFKKEIIDFSNNLGKFGQSYTNRKYSVYFCSVLIRIGNNTQNDLYKRLLNLCDDTDRVVKFESIYQIRYLIKECSPKYCSENILQYINIFLDDIEFNFRTIIIESVLVFNNLDKFRDIPNFMENLTEKINEIIMSDDDISLQNDFVVYKSIFNILLNVSLKSEKNRKIFIKLLKRYLKIYFFNIKIKENTNINNNNNDSNDEEIESDDEENEIKSKLKTDYIIEKFPEILSIFNEEKDIFFINELLKEGTKVFFINENKEIFYKKYHLMINKLPLGSYNLSKNFLDKVFFFLKDDFENNLIKNYYIYNQKNKNNSNNNFTNNEINSPLLSPSKKSPVSNKNAIPYKYLYNINNEKSDDINNKNINITHNSEFKEYYLKEINNIFKEMLLIKNDEFIIFILCKLESFYNIMININDWRLCIEMLKALENLPKYFLYNHSKYKNFSEINIKIFVFCKDLLKNSINITIEQEITNLLAELMLYDSICRKDVIEYMRKNYLENKSYFRRRIYLLFSNSIFEKFSFKFIRDTLIYNDLFENLLKNDNTLAQAWIIKLFNNYSVYEREVISLVKEIQEEQKKSANLDLLLNVEIKKYIINANNYQKNIFNEYKNKNRFKSREFLKMDNEDEIYKIEQDIILKKKKEESEKNNNNYFIENKAKSSTKIKNLINGIQISLNDNKKNNIKIFGNSKIKKKSGEMLPNGNGNYSSNINNTNYGNRATQRKSSMNYVRKNNFKEFNNNFVIKNNNNHFKYYKKNYSKEKNIKDDYHNTLRSPFRGNKNNKI